MGKNQPGTGNEEGHAVSWMVRKRSVFRGLKWTQIAGFAGCILGEYTDEILVKMEILKTSLGCHSHVRFCSEGNCGLLKNLSWMVMWSSRENRPRVWTIKQSHLEGSTRHLWAMPAQGNSTAVRAQMHISESRTCPSSHSPWGPWGQAELLFPCTSKI